jgi:fructose-1,6-bisphosphatase/inositol monophosphatase family enzyme
MSLPDPDKVAAAIRETAKIEVMPLFGKLAAGDIREKGPGDLVSIADEAAERHLTEWLPALLPGSLVIGEEAVAADPSVLDRLGESGDIWIVDPIDGTLNFCAAIPIFAVMVALVRRGETVGSWIYHPVSREMFSAIRGEGAWLDGARLQVATPGPLDAMSGAVSPGLVPDETRRADLRRHYLFHGEPGDFRCAGREYSELSRGGRHFTTYLGLKPWDHAPGILLHSEAGGYSATMDDGKPYSLQRHKGPLLAAPDRESWQALRALIYGN